MSIAIRILFGLLFFAVGVAMFLKQRKSAQNCTAPAQGEVTRYISETHYATDDNLPTEVYYPVVRYSVSGQWYERKSDVGKGKQKYEVGDRIDILYDPAKPETFVIKGDKSNLLLSVVFALAGIGIIVTAFLA